MRCLYREKKYVCGEYLEVDIFPVFRQPTGRRGKRCKPTSDVQKRLNRINAERKLIRLLNTNFSEADIRFDLTYRENPGSFEEAQRELRNFLRRLKRYRKKLGLGELKYIAVTEVGSRSGRVHHHIVMSGDVKIGDLARLWGLGYTTAKPLQFDEFGIVGIAKYLAKDPIGGKRWQASKNLEKPKEYSRDGRISKKKIAEIAKNPDCRERLEKIYEGYDLADVGSFYNDVNGGYYLTVRMRRRGRRGKYGR